MPMRTATTFILSASSSKSFEDNHPKHVLNFGVVSMRNCMPILCMPLPVSEGTPLTETELEAQIKLLIESESIVIFEEVLASESFGHNRDDRMTIITSEWTVRV